MARRGEDGVRPRSVEAKYSAKCSLLTRITPLPIPWRLQRSLPEAISLYVSETEISNSRATSRTVIISSPHMNPTAELSEPARPAISGFGLR